ncbi:hypothetical protein SNEBB_008871 [Seison nebaliae]|nr:hypothetical protein SNEBB_008871 [Seison nebaliae]
MGRNDVEVTQSIERPTRCNEGYLVIHEILSNNGLLKNKHNQCQSNNLPLIYHFARVLSIKERLPITPLSFRKRKIILEKNKLNLSLKDIMENDVVTSFQEDSIRTIYEVLKTMLFSTDILTNTVPQIQKVEKRYEAYFEYMEDINLLMLQAYLTDIPLFRQQFSFNNLGRVLNTVVFKPFRDATINLNPEIVVLEISLQYEFLRSTISQFLIPKKSANLFKPVTEQTCQNADMRPKDFASMRDAEEKFYMYPTNVPLGSDIDWDGNHKLIWAPTYRIIGTLVRVGMKIYKSDDPDPADPEIVQAARDYFHHNIRPRVCPFHHNAHTIQNQFGLLVSDIIRTFYKQIGHMYSIIRNLDDTGWFLISDSDVYRLENLRDYTKTFKYDSITTLYLEETYKSNNARELLKQIHNSNQLEREQQDLEAKKKLPKNISVKHNTL